MADFILTQKHKDKTTPRLKSIHGNRILRPTEDLRLFGVDESSAYFREGENFIAILGCCYYPGESIQNTAAKILKTFNEAIISDLKKSLLGQFIVIIKKNGLIYVFADFLQTRNIFYSEDFSIISSSFSVIEDVLGTSINYLDFNKVFEYIAMRYVTYPGWLGNKTIHFKIRRLRAFEYLVINTSGSVSRVGSVKFYFDNVKKYDSDKASTLLAARLKSIIENPWFQGKKIVVTLTGGYDSRPIAFIAANYYKKISFRLAASKKHWRSQYDARIARKIAKSLNIPLELFSATESDIDDRFSFLTEGLSSAENSMITPIIEKVEPETLGMGGCFGTEIFWPLLYTDTKNYIETIILNAQKYIIADQMRWKQLKNSLMEEFENIKKHYVLSVSNQIDEIRIFFLLSTGFFSSPMLSAYSHVELHLEPFGHFNILEIALNTFEKYIQIPVNSWREQPVKKGLMLRLNHQLGKFITTHYQPQLPYTIKGIHLYIKGFLIQLLDDWQHKINGLIKRIKAEKNYQRRVIMQDINYVSNGWDKLFLRHIKDKYGQET